MAEKYNGWTNYETWNVKLWMDNDQGSYRHYGERAAYWWDQSQYAAQVASRVWTREEAAAFLLADELKEEYESASNDWLNESGKACSVWADLIGAALSEVNWGEIAASLIEDTDKDEAENAEEAEAE